MKIKNTNIKDVKLLIPNLYKDERGFFMETFRADWFYENVSSHNFVQDNHSSSSQGILRGLHYQINKPQGKLVRVISGEVFDVAVDLRSNSPTFGCYVSEYLSAQNGHQLWVPPGFAHGFYVLSDTAEFVYKCTDYYNPKFEKCLLWNDPTIDIKWPLISSDLPLLSSKDINGISLDEAVCYE